VNIPADEEEKQEAHQRARPRTIVIYEAIREEGQDELERSSWATAFSALAAGLSMTLGLVAMGAFAAHLPDGTWRPLVSDLGYPLGYLIVILGRQQLFTENTLTPLLPVLSKPSWRGLAGIARIWAIVLVGNIVGAFIGAYFLARAQPMPAEAVAPMANFGVMLMQHDPLTRFVQAIFAGWLIALMVWLLPSAGSARLFVIILVTYVVAVARLPHVIAGSAEVAYGVLTHKLPLTAYFVSFLAPTLIGNTLGGVLFVALLNHAPVSPELKGGQGDDADEA